MRKGDLTRWIRRLTAAGSLLGIMGVASGPAWGDSRPAQPRTAPLYQLVQAEGAEAVPPSPPAEEKLDPANQTGPVHEEAPAPEPEDHPWTILDTFNNEDGTNRLKDNGWIFGGHSEWGYQSDPDGAFTGNGPLLNQKEWAKFNLNQQYLFLGKVADGKEGLGFGFRADLIYGVDGNEGQSFGNVNPGHYDYLNGWDRGIYEWALPQLYGEVAYKDLSVKIGHFYTPTGYEVVPATGNFFFSRQITWYNGEPFTHTGALATYKASDKLTLTGGWALGWDTGFYQFNQGNLAILGAAWTITENTTLTYFGAYGNSGWRGSRSALTGFILSHKWTDKLTTLHQFDVLGTNNGSDPVAPGGNFAVDGVAGDSVASVNYLFYDFTKKLRGGIRQEWCKADGISYYTLTGGVNIKPSPNLIFRPEVRYLWSPGVPGGAPGTIAANVADVYGNTVVFGIDMIVTF